MEGVGIQLISKSKTSKTIKESKGRINEYNKLLLDYATRETKGLIEVYKRKIRKKQLEMDLLREEMSAEQTELKIVIEKMNRPQKTTYEKISDLRFVKNIEMENDSIVINTRDLIVNNELNMGEYSISIPARGSIRVKRKDGALNGEKYGAQHIFIDSGYGLCTGSTRLSEKISEWRRQGLIHLVVGLVWDILSNYDLKQGRQYATYADMKAAAKRRNKK